MQHFSRHQVLTISLFVIFTSSVTFSSPAESASKYLLKMLSENYNGPNNANANYPFISSNGRFVVFQGAALVPEDNSGVHQVYLYDRDTDTIELISEAADGGGADRQVFLPTYAAARVVSEDGRYVVFRSGATNLLDSVNQNGYQQIWLRDRQTGTTSLVSADSDGVEGNWSSSDFSIAPDGWGVIFTSGSSNLDDLDPNSNGTSTFLHQLSDRSTNLACFDKFGDAMGDCFQPSLSCTGIMVFRSGDSDAAPDDLHSGQDVFFGNPLAGNNVRMSVPTSGDEGPQNNNYTSPSISCDGQRIVFATPRVLTLDDTNSDWDLYVYDLDIGSPRLLLAPGGVSLEPTQISISANGEWMTFAGTASLAPEDNDSVSDIYSFFYSRNRLMLGDMRLVSQNKEKREKANAISTFSAVADNGVVAFESGATNLITNYQVNGGKDIFADPYEVILNTGFEP